MADTNPTLTGIASEALKKTGLTEDLTAGSKWLSYLNRAQNAFVEEIKADIFTAEKELQPLQTFQMKTLTDGLALYSFPSNFGTLISMTLCDGTVSGEFQAGSTTTSWVLDSDDASTEAGIIGSEIVVTAGTGLNQVGQVTAYDTTTKIATVSGCTVAPASGDSYLIISSYYDLSPLPLQNYERMRSSATPGTPTQYVRGGNTGVGEFYAYPTPYRSSSIPFVIKERYYANILELNIASDETLLTTLYERWQNLWTQGIFAKALQSQDDTRADAELNRYYSMLKAVVSREKYGAEDLSGLSISPGMK